MNAQKGDARITVRRLHLHLSCCVAGLGTNADTTHHQTAIL